MALSKHSFGVSVAACFLNSRVACDLIFMHGGSHIAGRFVLIMDKHVFLYFKRLYCYGEKESTPLFAIDVVI